MPKKRTSVTTSPINFRMPAPLRARLRRFAKTRNLAEAEALRLLVSEHLDEVDSERELAEAERWQFAQAYASLQRVSRGEQAIAPSGEVDRIFTAALTRRPTTRPR